MRTAAAGLVAADGAAIVVAAAAAAGSACPNVVFVFAGGTATTAARARVLIMPIMVKFKRGKHLSMVSVVFEQHLNCEKLLYH